MERCCVVTGFRPREKGLETGPTRIAMTMRKDESNQSIDIRLFDDLTSQLT